MSKRDAFEHGLEKSIFASRWLLAPVYVGLIFGLVVVLVKFLTELWKLITDFDINATAEATTVALLTLIDLALLGNLIIIVIFAGYENFVSKMAIAEDAEDRPGWMGHVDFSGLKMKLIGSLVAISAILLLKDFVDAGRKGYDMDYEAVGWRIGLHFTFVLSGLMFALMDYWGAKRLRILHDIAKEDGRLNDLESYDPDAA